MLQQRQIDGIAVRLLYNRCRCFAGFLRGSRGFYSRCRCATRRVTEGTKVLWLHGQRPLQAGITISKEPNSVTALRLIVALHHTSTSVELGLSRQPVDLDALTGRERLPLLRFRLGLGLSRQQRDRHSIEPLSHCKGWFPQQRGHGAAVHSRLWQKSNQTTVSIHHQ